MNTEQIQALATLMGVENKPQPTPDMHPISGMHIVAADRGFVWVGECERSGDCLLIHRARNNQWMNPTALTLSPTRPASRTRIPAQPHRGASYGGPMG